MAMLARISRPLRSELRSLRSFSSTPTATVGKVLVWGNGNNGQLGLGELKTAGLMNNYDGKAVGYLGNKASYLGSFLTSPSGSRCNRSSSTACQKTVARTHQLAN